ncbi:hypothetical protein H0E87_002237 [Populus deltoides]|uniref:Cytochrome c oxidase subunit Vb n=1 Tax=Populus deltoides TaxID=3696 RepID=A0A8T2ZWE9_POPDE|nr:hypothetical protein H0E87_002237 [Populus deltoides]
MWRRLASSHLRTLVTTTTTTRSTQSLLLNRSIINPSSSTSLFNRYFSADSVDGAVKKRVEDVMPIATGHEREELEAELEGKKLLDIDYPDGPFGTKEKPAVIKSYYDKRIVGCPGGEGEDEHDVVWFWLEKGKPHECPCAHRTLCWKLWALEDRLMDTVTKMIIITNCSFQFCCWNKI